MTVGIVILHDLENQTSFEGLVRHEGDGCGDVAAVDADHVGMLVITKVTHFLGFLVPGVPDDRVGEVVLLDPHLPSRHHHLEPLGPESQGDERLRRRRAPQHDLCERRARLHPGYPDATPGI